MLRITCPNNNIPERTYAIEVLLIDVLECNRHDFEIQFSDSVKNYELVIDNNKVIVEDHFFNHYIAPLSYLKLENLPTELRYYHAHGMEIPIIYGEDRFVQEEGTIVIGLDVFASTFFMLTRWEESLLGREEKGDCDETQLFAVRNGFYSRPIVNEYANLLRQILPTSFPLSKRKYKVVLTHDVDGFMTPTYTEIVKTILRQIRYGAPKNRVLNLSWLEKLQYRQVYPTAYSQFEYYTQLAQKYAISEWFYFKVCAKGETEATYEYDSSTVRNVIHRLQQEKNPNIVLGFHPSQSTFNNSDQWGRECSRIEGLLESIPIIGRNHHLLYNMEMLKYWEKSFSTEDLPVEISNSVFHGRQGFRSGIAVPYTVFDYLERRPLRIIEHPCQIMDTVIRYNSQKCTDTNQWKDMTKMIDDVKKINGELVLTWHIYIRNKHIIKDYSEWCDKIINYAK